MKSNKYSASQCLRWTLPVIAAFSFLETALGVTDPTLTVGLIRTNGNVNLTWSDANAVTYQVQTSSTLISWTNLGSVFTGTGLPLSFTTPVSGQSCVFFRVQRIFPATPGSAAFDPVTGVLTVVGDLAHTVLSVANDGTGNIAVNSGAMPISGGMPTVVNTVLIQVLGSTGDDQITIGSGLPPAHLFGAEGNDTLTGGSNSELIIGGPGNDTVSGKQGNDLIYLGEGNDTVIWNPGDGSDTVRGEGGSDTVEFTGANVNENIILSANGPALVLSRDVANITFTSLGVEKFNLHALGGADNITVNSLVGTAVTQVNVDLASTIGTTNGDAQADTVMVNATAGADIFNVAANGTAVDVTGVGLGTLVHVTNAELANDRIAFTGVGNDIVNVNGTALADNMQVLPSPTLGYARVVASGFTVPVDVIGALTLSVNGLGGKDTIVGATGLAALNIPIRLDGGDDDDSITGGDEADTITGGLGNDMISGGRGNDDVFMGDGNDTFIWNPGDGSDTVEGQVGSDTLQFNGANVAENINFSANGSRFRLSRDVANITLDADGVETVSLQALGGADNITVSSLIATMVTRVNIDLAATPGSVNGDASADTITVNGTVGPDTFHAAANGTAVEVASAGVLVHVTGAELANDRISLTGIGNDTVNVNGSALADNMQVTPSPVAGFIRTIVSGYTLPVDVNGSLTLAVNGLAGGDTITGANGLAALGIPIVLDGGNDSDAINGGDEADVINGGLGNDVISGGRGNDDVFMGDGNDTFIWNPGDGSDTVDGQIGNDTLQFNCANVTEHITLSANGARFTLFRDVANINMDVDGLEIVNLPTLGGADTITVNSLVGTAVTQVNIDLGATGGTGDGSADAVIVNGTPAPDTISVTGSAGVVAVTGLSAQVQIVHPEVALDLLTVNGLGGTDSFSLGAGATSLIGVILNQ